jgi:hypothetical protein
MLPLDEDILADRGADISVKRVFNLCGLLLTPPPGSSEGFGYDRPTHELTAHERRASIKAQVMAGGLFLVQCAQAAPTRLFPLMNRCCANEAPLLEQSQKHTALHAALVLFHRVMAAACRSPKELENPLSSTENRTIRLWMDAGLRNAL